VGVDVRDCVAEAVAAILSETLLYEAHADCRAFDLDRIGANRVAVLVAVRATDSVAAVDALTLSKVRVERTMDKECVVDAATSTDDE
jgi:hypothetical protein